MGPWEQTCKSPPPHPPYTGARHPWVPFCVSFWLFCIVAVILHLTVDIWCLFVVVYHWFFVVLCLFFFIVLCVFSVFSHFLLCRCWFKKLHLTVSILRTLEMKMWSDPQWHSSAQILHKILQYRKILKETFKFSLSCGFYFLKQELLFCQTHLHGFTNVSVF